jgi:hypothetical protein
MFVDIPTVPHQKTLSRLTLRGRCSCYIRILRILVMD